MWADQVRSEHAVRSFFHEHLESVDRLGGLPGGVPVGRLLFLDAELKALLPGLVLVKAGRGDRRDAESNTRHAEGVGVSLISVQHILRGYAPLIGRNGGQKGSARGSVASRVDGRIRNALHGTVQRE